MGKLVTLFSGLDTDKTSALVAAFASFETVADEWKQKVESIVVTSVDQISEMQMARIGRLEMREKRIAVENTRKRLKEQSLKEGQAIDAIARYLKGLIEPVEKYLEEQEKFVELKEAREAEERRQKAEALLREQEAREAAERAAKEAAEREAMRIENERLRKEKEEADRLRQESERRAAEEKRVADERVRQEQLKSRQAEEAQRRAEADRKAAIERTRLVQERKNEEIREVRSEVRVLQKKLLTCPKCGHEFPLQPQ